MRLSPIRRLTLLLALAALSASALAAPLTPTPQEARDVRRVPGREERPRLQFPAAEAWSLVETQADPGVETRSFVPARPLGEPPVDLATVTVLHDLWNADLARTQHLFGRQLSTDCPGVRATLLRQDTTDVRRRLVLWTCPDADPPFSSLQLLLQGRDDLFSVELFSRSGLLSDGLQVRWSDWLWNAGLCLHKGQGEPCPPDNWDRLSRQPETP
ncbi:MAG: hypothetical protein WC326_06615 [Candidatus Delongbacteria bacterium]